MEDLDERIETLVRINKDISGRVFLRALGPWRITDENGVVKTGAPEWGQKDSLIEVTDIIRRRFPWAWKPLNRTTANWIRGG